MKTGSLLVYWWFLPLVVTSALVFSFVRRMTETLNAEGLTVHSVMVSALCVLLTLCAVVSVVIFLPFPKFRRGPRPPKNDTPEEGQKSDRSGP